MILNKAGYSCKTKYPASCCRHKNKKRVNYQLHPCNDTYLTNRSLGNRVLGSIVQTVIITIIVGGYLWFIFQVPIEFSIFGILVGSIIAINFLGFPIQEILRRNKFIRKYFIDKQY